jgi:hypothetical protein
MPISSAQPTVPGSSSNITPDQVQQMIISTLSALGLQGKKHLLTSPCLIDYAASSHMTGSSVTLHDVCKYDGEQHIQAVLFLLLRLEIWGLPLLMFSCLLIYLTISILLDN